MALPRPPATVLAIVLAAQLVFSASSFAQEAAAAPGPPVVTTAERAPGPAAPLGVPPQTCPPRPDPWAEYIRAQQIAHLRIRVDLLRESNRNKRPPRVVLGIGITSLVVGGVVFARAWNASDEYSVAGDRAGLVLMPLGALLTLIGVPLLGVRMSRDLRLRRAERVLRAVEGRP